MTYTGRMSCSVTQQGEFRPEDPLANSGAYIMLFHDNDPDGVSNSLFKNPQSSVHFI
jgi:hypothetical protein